jgi:hypothetical protein
LWNAELRAGLKQWTGVVSWLESCEEGKSGMEEELEKYLARRNEFDGEQSLKSAEIAMRSRGVGGDLSCWTVERYIKMSQWIWRTQRVTY